MTPVLSEEGVIVAEEDTASSEVLKVGAKLDADSALIAAKNVIESPRSAYSFTLTNDTSVDMLEFYASPETVTDWEDDVLGEKTIRANGDWTLITLSGQRGCVYDFLAVFADGDKLEKYGIDVCMLEAHTYYEN